MDYTMILKEIEKNIKLIGYNKLNSKHGISIYIKNTGLVYSQAFLVASPTPKYENYELEIGILNLHLENSVLEIEQAQIIGVYSLHYGWKAGEISGKYSSPVEIDNFFQHLKNMDKEIYSNIEFINKESLESLKFFRDNVFFQKNTIRKYGSYEAIRGVIQNVIEKGYLDDSIENSALSSLSSNPTEYKQLEFKLELLKKHIALKEKIR